MGTDGQEGTIPILLLPTPHTRTQIITTAASKMHVFALFKSIAIDGPTDGQTKPLIPGHPAELSDSVKLLLTGAKSHVFEIDPVLKSIY